VRSGSSSEEQGYVANLGHRADPESFLTYMRARYYEPMSGRFISEDLVGAGVNWFAYCANNPVGRTDVGGQFDTWAWVQFTVGTLFILVGLWLLGASYCHENTGREASWLLSKYKNLPGFKGSMFGKGFVDYFEGNKHVLDGTVKAANKLSGLTKLLGYILIISGLLMDIELASGNDTSYDIVVFLFGEQ
jgi:RHS repeat-associated protein